MSAIRRTLPLLLLSLAAAPVLDAAPKAQQPPLVVVELEHNAVGHRMFLSTPQQASVEPGGFEITAATPTEWLDLGFQTGDRILSENGRPVGERLMVSDGLYLFQVIRNGKPLILEVIIHAPPRRTRTIDEQYFDKLLAQVSTPDARSAPVRNAAGPSGVRVIDMLLSLYLECDVGDVIRTIDGQPIRTDAELTSAIQNLRVGATDIELERLGRPLTLTVIRKAPLDLTGVKKVTATNFEVTRVFADAVIADSSILLRKIETAPYLKNGKQHGFTVFHIEPTSPAATLGLLDGDIVFDLDGHSIDTFRDVIDVVDQLQTATSLTVHVERKGKVLALAYTVK